MGRTKQTRRAPKNKRFFKAKKAANEDEKKAETKESKEGSSPDDSVAENAPVSSQKTEKSETASGETASGETSVENTDEAKHGLKRKQEETSSDVDSNAEDSKKVKGNEEKPALKEVSIRIERW